MTSRPNHPGDEGRVDHATADEEGAGWRDDPLSGDGWQRYWDGLHWTGDARSPSIEWGVGDGVRSYQEDVRRLVRAFMGVEEAAGGTGARTIAERSGARTIAERSGVAGGASPGSGGAGSAGGMTGTGQPRPPDAPPERSAPVADSAPGGGGAGRAVRVSRATITVRSARPDPGDPVPDGPRAAADLGGPPSASRRARVGDGRAQVPRGGQVLAPPSGPGGRRTRSRGPWLVAGGVAAALALGGAAFAVESGGGRPSTQVGVGAQARDPSTATAPTAPTGTRAPVTRAPVTTAPVTAPATTAPATTAPATTAPVTTAPATTVGTSPAGTCPTGGLLVSLTSSARIVGVGRYAVAVSGTVTSTANHGLHLTSLDADLVANGADVRTVPLAPASATIAPGGTDALHATVELAAPGAPSVTFSTASASWGAGVAGTCPHPH